MELAFEQLTKQAESLLRSDISAEQAVCVLTGNGNVRWFLNHDIMSGNTSDEAAFIESLKEGGDTGVRYAVCMWRDFWLDVPSWHLRERLVQLNASNRETEVLLRGGDGFVVKPLKVMVPPGTDR